MAWDRTAPVDPKYRSKAHRDYCAALKRQLRSQGYLMCAAVICLFDTRMITNPNGRDQDGLTAGHLDDGVGYRGPEHRRCGSRDGAVRARARQDGPTGWAL